MAVHSSTLAWEFPWTEEPDGLQSMGSQRVRLDLVTKQQQNGLSRKGLYLLISQKRAVGGLAAGTVNQSSDDVLALFPTVSPSALPSSGMAVCL